jgi:benzoylformate decarboxylase
MIGVEAMLANVDATQLPKPLVKWSYEPANAQDVPRALSQAIHYANTTPKAPVYLSIPYDDWDQPSGPGVEHLIERDVQTAGTPDARQLQVLVQQVQDARNPVLVLGPDVDATLSNDHAVALADKLRMPVWIAPSASRCPFPTRHPSFRGVLPAAIAGISKTLQGHDLIIVVGAPVFRYHQFAPGDYLPVGAQLLHITSDPLEATRAPMGHALVGDIREPCACWPKKSSSSPGRIQKHSLRLSVSPTSRTTCTRKRCSMYSMRSPRTMPSMSRNRPRQPRHSGSA